MIFDYQKDIINGNGAGHIWLDDRCLNCNMKWFERLVDDKECPGTAKRKEFQ